MSEPNEPYCMAMVICDAVHQDPATHKFSLLGTFDSLRARSFPTFVQLCVYFAITDGKGDCKLTVQLVDAKAGTIMPSDSTDTPGRLFHLSGDRFFDSPHRVLEESLELGVQIPGAGIYHCELWANDLPLMSRRLVVKSAATGNPGGQQS